MFGEIYGEEIVSIDNKGRIYLHKFTNAEPNEYLAFIEYQNAYYLTLLTKVKENIENLKTKRNNSHDPKEIEDLEKKILSLFETIKKVIKVDNQARITLPAKICKESKQVRLNGCGDYLRLTLIKENND